MGRSQLDDSVSGDKDDSVGIVRQFPRVGAQFQTRISKSTDFTIRPAPKRISVDFPHILEQEARPAEQNETNGMLKLIQNCKRNILCYAKIGRKPYRNFLCSIPR